MIADFAPDCAAIEHIEPGDGKRRAALEGTVRTQFPTVPYRQEKPALPNCLLPLHTRGYLTGESYEKELPPSARWITSGRARSQASMPRPSGLYVQTERLFS